MAVDMPVDVRALHLEVQIKYAEVALEPTNQFHFHTGRRLAEKVDLFVKTPRQPGARWG